MKIAVNRKKTIHFGGWDDQMHGLLWVSSKTPHGRYMSTVAKPEPAVKTGTAIGALGALLTLLVVFGINLSEAQTEAILGFAVAAAPLAAGLLIRGKVRPVETSIDIPVTGNTNSGAGAVSFGSRTPSPNDF